VIVEAIQKANFEALKNKDTIARSCLSMVWSHYKLLEKEKSFTNETIGDQEMIRILQKQIKESVESSSYFARANNQAKVDEISKQIEIMQSFLPKMLSDEEISKIIADNKLEDMISAMRYFKANYQGVVDLKKVSDRYKK
jgi:uncharacterized protein YqeY